MVHPVITPESTRMPGPVGRSKRVIVPGEGAKPLVTSSALMRNSKAWPLTSGSFPAKERGRPAATRNCSAMMSTPVTCSVIGCSTCTRVLTSRKETVPSSETMYSTVPADW